MSGLSICIMVGFRPSLIHSEVCLNKTILFRDYGYAVVFRNNRQRAASVFQFKGNCGNILMNVFVTCPPQACHLPYANLLLILPTIPVQVLHV